MARQALRVVPCAVNLPSTQTDATFIDILKTKMYLKISVLTAQKTRCVSVTKTNQSTQYREIIAVYFYTHAKHINTPAERRVCYGQASQGISYLQENKITKVELVTSYIEASF
jgi:biopolymer transport protein ExbD